MLLATQDGLRPVLREIHQYWFGALASPSDLPLDKKEIWFRQSDLTDAYIKKHFGSDIPIASSLDWEIGTLAPPEQIGLVILLDQYSRNCYRGSGEAYANDEKARTIAGQAIKQGKERFALIEQMFLAITFEHSENIADQDYAVWLMSGIAVEASEHFPDYARWALDSFILHRDLIRRFGRFPSRNAALGRTSTPEEQAFLSETTSANVSNPTEGTTLGRTRP
jgi:uncharacterized protein (DUF924 family)